MTNPLLGARTARNALAVMVISGAAAFAPPAQAALPETLTLDSYTSPSVKGAYGPVTTTDVLPAGEVFLVDVEGTAAHFVPHRWMLPNKVCGTSEPDAIFPSPGRTPSQVGQDAEFVFALPMPAGWKCATYPEHKTAFQIDTGSGYRHVEAEGSPTAPRADHVYTYRITGEGQPVSFRMEDGFTGDNYGMFKITVSAEDGCAGACEAPSPPPPPVSAMEESISIREPNASPPGRPRACTSLRRFRIRVVSRRRNPVVSAQIWLDGKRLLVRPRRIRGERRLTATVDLRGKPQRRVTLRIRARTRSGRILTGTRRYWTCRARLPFGTPKL